MVPFGRSSSLSPDFGDQLGSDAFGRGRVRPVRLAGVQLGAASMTSERTVGVGNFAFFGIFIATRRLRSVDVGVRWFRWPRIQIEPRPGNLPTGFAKRGVLRGVTEREATRQRGVGKSQGFSGRTNQAARRRARDSIGPAATNVAFRWSETAAFRSSEKRHSAP